MTTNDLVVHGNKTYHLADLAHHMEYEEREAIHSSDTSGTAAGFWAAFIAAYPESADHLAAITPAAK